MTAFSQNYLGLLKEFEGYFAEPYICPAGKCTIGYGTNLEAHRKFIPFEDIRKGNQKGTALKKALINRGMRWSKEESEAAMKEELEKTHTALMRDCKAYRVLREKGDIPRAEALLDMAYNMGVATLLTFKSTLPMIERGEYEKAADNLTTSRWYKQVGRRSKAICKIIKTGEYVKL